MDARGVELLVVDTSPRMTMAIWDALEISDIVLLPIKPSRAVFKSFGRLIHLDLNVGRLPVSAIDYASPWARIASQAVVILSQCELIALAIVYFRSVYSCGRIDAHTVPKLNRRSDCLQ